MSSWLQEAKRWIWCQENWKLVFHIFAIIGGHFGPLVFNGRWGFFRSIFPFHQECFCAKFEESRGAHPQGLKFRRGQVGLLSATGSKSWLSFVRVHEFLATGGKIVRFVANKIMKILISAFCDIRGPFWNSSFQWPMVFLHPDFFFTMRLPVQRLKKIVGDSQQRLKFVGPCWAPLLPEPKILKQSCLDQWVLGYMRQNGEIRCQEKSENKHFHVLRYSGPFWIPVSQRRCGFWRAIFPFPQKSACAKFLSKS